MAFRSCRGRSAGGVTARREAADEDLALVQLPIADRRRSGSSRSGGADESGRKLVEADHQAAAPAARRTRECHGRSWRTRRPPRSLARGTKLSGGASRPLSSAVMVTTSKGKMELGDLADHGAERAQLGVQHAGDDVVDVRVGGYLDVQGRRACPTQRSRAEPGASRPTVSNWQDRHVLRSTLISIVNHTGPSRDGCFLLNGWTFPP